MNKCRITVLKRLLDEELVKEYGFEGFGKCPVHEEGQFFYADFKKPEGFCDEAWKAIYQYAFALSSGGDSFYYDDWISKPGVAISWPNDGEAVEKFYFIFAGQLPEECSESIKEVLDCSLWVKRRYVSGWFISE